MKKKDRSTLLGIALGVSLPLLGWAALEWYYAPPVQPLVLRPTGEPAEARHAMIDKAFLHPDREEDLPTPPGLTQFFARLGFAEANKKPVDWADLFDADRLISEASMADLGGSMTLPSRENRPYLVRKALKALAADGGLGLPGQHIQVFKIVSLPGRVEAIVCVRHDYETGSAPFRWWMIHRDGEWWAYDFEDIRLGMRLSEQLGYQLLAATDRDRSQKMVASLNQLRKATRLMRDGDASQANEALRQVDRQELPRGQQVLASLLDANLALIRGQYSEARSHLDATAQMRTGVATVELLRATLEFKQKHYLEAMKHARNYEQMVGPDPEAQYLLKQIARDAEAGEKPRKPE